MTEQQIKEFHQRYPEQLMKLYRKYGVNKTPDVQTTLDLVAVMGEPFLFDMFEIYHDEQSFLGFLFNRKKKNSEYDISDLSAEEQKYLKDKYGSSGTQGKQREKGQLWDKFKKGFQDVIGMVKTGQQTAEGVKGSVDGMRDSGSNSRDGEGGSGLILGMKPGLFFGIVVVLVVTVVLVVIYVRKK